MKSLTTSKFWKAYLNLPPEIQRQAQKTYLLWQRDPWHAALRFEQKGKYWSVRINQGWRALGRRDGENIYWLWIGSHDEYERLIGDR